MIKAKDCKDMKDVRSEIDIIDKRIVELIATRGCYVKQAAKFKQNETAVRDSNRVI